MTTSAKATRAALFRMAGLGVLTLALSACAGGPREGTTAPREARIPDQFNPRVDDQGRRRSTLWDLFANNADPNVTVAVNRYLWNASLDVLNFLPIQTIDPFSGVIVTGYGRPPGGGTPYRATIYVRDPALDARSLTVALATRGGPVGVDTQRAVEDAILTRARQLRIREGNL